MKNVSSRSAAKNALRLKLFDAVIEALVIAQQQLQILAFIQRVNHCEAVVFVNINALFHHGMTVDAKGVTSVAHQMRLVTPPAFGVWITVEKIVKLHHPRRRPSVREVNAVQAHVPDETPEPVL